MRLFGRYLATKGTHVQTYFEFRKPRGLTVSVAEIVTRANTSFVLGIRRPDGVEDFPAEVSLFSKTKVFLSILRSPRPGIESVVNGYQICLNLYFRILRILFQ